MSAVMTEALFHWSMVAYYAYADLTGIRGLIHAHSLRGRDPDDPTTNRMVYGSLTYITIWNMVVQQIYFILCCYEHIMAGVSNKEKEFVGYKKTRMAILRSILFPTTWVVSIIYWWVYWRSPTLIFGDILGEIYPPWMDHSMHTFIVPIAIIELYLSARREREADGGIFKGWITCNAFLTVYTATVIIARLVRGVWPYPFLDPANNGSPAFFFVYLYVTGGIWYYIGMHLTQKVWGNHSHSREKQHLQ